MAKSEERKQTQGEPGERRSGKERREDFKKRKLEQAQRDDTEVISRRALETSDFIRLINSNDYIVNQLRQRMFRKNGVPTDVASRLLEENEEIRERINRHNAEMCKAMGMPYKPPRGYQPPNL